MRLIGWAIALAAAGLTPAAMAQAPAVTSGATTQQPAGGFAQNAIQPDAATAPVSDQSAAAGPSIAGPMPANSYGVYKETAASNDAGEPILGGRGIQKQVTPLGEEAASFHNDWLLPLCAIISIIVLGLLLYAMIRFRRGANPTPSRNSHNTLIEVVWTLVPCVILAGIAIPSIGLLRKQYSPPPADVTVKVTGHQWYWSYEYPDNGVTFDSYMLKEASDPTRQANQRARTDFDGPPLLAVDHRVVIPVGKVVKFLITADDVIHSFAVPAFWIKQDANPGQLHETWVKVDRPGVYFGQCSELCGARHGFMPIAVEAVPQAQFAAWVASQGGHLAGAKPAATPAAASVAPPAPGTPAAAQPQGATPATQPATNQAATAQN